MCAVRPEGDCERYLVKILRVRSHLGPSRLFPFWFSLEDSLFSRELVGMIGQTRALLSPQAPCSVKVCFCTLKGFAFDMVAIRKMVVIIGEEARREALF